jgi:hypothetical protein
VGGVGPRWCDPISLVVTSTATPVSPAYGASAPVRLTVTIL